MFNWDIIIGCLKDMVVTKKIYYCEEKLHVDWSRHEVYNSSWILAATVIFNPVTSLLCLGVQHNV